MSRLSWRARLTLALAAVVVLGIALVVIKSKLDGREQERQRSACRALGEEVLTHKRQVFDPSLEEMRQIRLNEAQARTLKETDANAFIRYSARVNQSVEKVAQAGERLGAYAKQIKAAGCLNLP
ncbi:hypothetical protein [Cyanobium sp. Morenito 9A2]|uniref:hypothetical protein n=1 Tax=Cyanobium sp. Morenito 9A2 TaxID=2823718 RepID=UPI0020CC937E|nr:hypothetical protein [Cyanobium sp. Morenito 9A2]MCP9848734.1 hypothetical protein [Cyanobium sp. Morenito 9A2]